MRRIARGQCITFTHKVCIDDPRKAHYKPHTLFHVVPSAAWLRNQEISWGEPAEIAQAKADKCCPRCGAIKGQGYIKKDARIIPGGFELVFDPTDEFGARCLCNNCGFSF